MAKLVINDIFDELREENKRLLNENKLIYDLLDKYRMFSMNLQKTCSCHQKSYNDFVFKSLESEHQKIETQNKSQLKKSQAFDENSGKLTVNSKTKHNNKRLKQMVYNGNKRLHKTNNQKKAVKDTDSDTDISDGSVDKPDEYSPESDDTYIAEELSDSRECEETSDMFVCDYIGCGMSFNKKASLRHHTQSIHTLETIPQTDLELYYESEEEPEEERAKRKELMAKCYEQLVCLIDGCNKRYPNRRFTFESHMNNIHFKRKPYICRKCNERFVGRDGLLVHFKKHQLEEVTAQDTSEQLFTSDSNELEIKSSYSEEEIKQIIAQSFDKNICPFSNCKKVIVGSGHRSRMESHLNTRHFNRKPYECHLCGKCFPSRENLESHIRLHRFGPRKRKNPKIFSCSWDGCSYKNERRVNLNEHICKEHTHERPFQCSHCEKTFYSARYQRDHMKNHWAPEKKLHCDLCSYSSPNKVHLERHKNRHSNVKTFKCDVVGCGKYFKTQYEINSHHKRMHIRGKPFTCDWPGCDKRYKFKSILEVHKSYHLNERKYKCDFEGCGRRLNNLTDLRSHKRKHIYSYECSWPACEQRFKIKSQLKNHMNMHQNIKEFVCEYPNCGRTYLTKSTIDRHRKRCGHQLIHS